MSETSVEKTFHAFTPAEASAYAQFRLEYHDTLYKTLLGQHVSTGGKLDTLLDVGCGPGTVVRRLGLRFQHAVGLDPSEGMITSAREFGGTSGNGEPIRFQVSSAEELSGIADESIDLITAARAAHWFDMPTFWASAARVLKPGGSVALWTNRGVSLAESVPNVAAIQAAVDAMKRKHLAPHMLPGNLISHGLYTELALPWDVEPPVAAFDKASFFRAEWGTGREGSFPGDELFSAGQPEIDMDRLEAMMGTMSAISRWREANGGKAGTEEDVVRLIRREIERLLHEAGVEVGRETIKTAQSGALLVVKKS